MSARSFFTALMCVVLFAGAAALAQDQQNQQGDRGRRRDGGNFDPAQFRQRMLENIREQLGPISDEEWQVLSPKIEKVTTAQRELRFGFGFGRRGGFGGPGGPGGDMAETPVARAVQDLRQTLQDENASVDLIVQKLTALREARAKAQADLQAAQKELKELLSQRQEAVLVMMGILE